MKKTKILIIRFRQLGDSILSSSLCTSIKRSIPNSEIHYVLNEHIAPVFENHPDVDKVITFSDEENKKIWIHIKKIWKTVRQEKYDIIIDTRATTKTTLFSAFSLRTKYRIGRKKSYTRFFHNYRIDNLPDNIQDTVSLTLKLIEPLEKEYLVRKYSDFYLAVDPIEKDDFRKKMELIGVDFSKSLILCTVTTRRLEKCWDIDKMRDVIQLVVDNYKDIQLIFNYGNEVEKKAAIDMCSQITNNKLIFTNIEAENVKDLAAMLSNCDFYFGNEGGARHIAQALNIPSFAIFSPHARKATWLPSPSENNQGIEAEDVMEDTSLSLTNNEKFDLISVEDVWNKLNYLMKQHGFT